MKEKQWDYEKLQQGIMVLKNDALGLGRFSEFLKEII